MNRLFLLVAVVATVLLTGCDELKVEIPVDSVKFDFEAMTRSPESSGVLKSGTMNPFSGTRTINLNDIEDADLKEYANKIIDVMLDNAYSQVNVTTVPLGDYSVFNLKVEIDGISEHLSIASYKVGDEFVPPANLSSFAAAFFVKLVKEDSFTVTVSGETDAPEGTIVHISYECYDLKFVAKPL